MHSVNHAPPPVNVVAETRDVEGVSVVDHARLGNRTESATHRRTEQPCAGTLPRSQTDLGPQSGTGPVFSPSWRSIRSRHPASADFNAFRLALTAATVLRAEGF